MQDLAWNNRRVQVVTIWADVQMVSIVFFYGNYIDVCEHFKIANTNQYHI